MEFKSSRKENTRFEVSAYPIKNEFLSTMSIRNCQLPNTHTNRTNYHKFGVAWFPITSKKSRNKP